MTKEELEKLSLELNEIKSIYKETLQLCKTDKALFETNKATLLQLKNTIKKGSLRLKKKEDSGIAEKKGSKLLIKANFIFYGTEANLDYCSNIICEIEQMWNTPKVYIKLNKKKYKVVFEFTFEVKTIKETIELALKNKTPENNFIRLETKNPKGYSFMMLNDNSGFWITSDNLGKSTTAPHEVGHGFGLKHSDGNQKGKGQPDIMAARGTLVDKEFQYNPNAKNGEPGSTINPKKRKVTKKEIITIVKQLEFDKKGIANIGNASNRLFRKIK